LIRELDALDPDLPVLMEHLRTEEAYRGAADHLRAVAGDLDVVI
jgi:hypothetical protein